MIRHVLITGGAGFIGSHLAEELLTHGYRVRVLDALAPQVHGTERRVPEYLDDDVELVIGDVRDPETVEESLDGVEAVFHLAAAVGVGQSMYRVADYTSVNNFGTAVLLEALAKRPVERLVVASSMTLYGEGCYRTPAGDVCADVQRSPAALARGEWDPKGPSGSPLTPVPTPETQVPRLDSVYALSKYDQERMCRIVGRAYGVPTVTLRLFNVYGPRQALSNPYTGVLGIFAARLLDLQPPLVFEDGQQRRDFVSVRDVARAFRLAMEVEQAKGGVLNIGSGRSFTIRQIASRMAAVLGHGGIEPEITGQYRVGDIRHCFADITLARRVLGYEPKVELEDGFDELGEWLATQFATHRVAEARDELSARELTL
jgi:dTDP-L-rhamnose 4-epimerase